MRFSKEHITDIYNLGPLLGTGTYGKVRLGTLKRAPSL
jgi:hypothetical protein